MWRILFSEGVWLTLEAVMTRGLMILAMMFAAKTLGSVEFGRLSIIQTTIVMLAYFISDGLKVTAAQQISKHGEENSSETCRLISVLFLVTFFVGFIVILCTYFLAPWISDYLLNDAMLVPSLRVGLLLLLAEALNGLSMGIMTGLREFRSMALAGIVRGVMLICFVFMGASKSVDRMMWALTLSSLIGLGLRGVFIWGFHKQTASIIKVEIRKSDVDVLLNVTLPALLSGLCFAPVNWLVSVILVHSSDGYHEMGIFGVALQWFSLLMFLPGIIANVLLPHLSGSYSRGEIQVMWRVLWMGVKVNLLIAIPAVLVVAAFEKYIMAYYGSSYLGAGSVLVLAAIAAFSASIQNLITSLFVSINRMWESLLTQFTWAFVYILGAYIMVALGKGAAGVAEAMVAAYVVKMLHSGVQSRGAMQRIREIGGM